MKGGILINCVVIYSTAPLVFCNSSNNNNFRVAHNLWPQSKVTQFLVWVKHSHLTLFFFFFLQSIFSPNKWETNLQDIIRCLSEDSAPNNIYSIYTHQSKYLSSPGLHAKKAKNYINSVVSTLPSYICIVIRTKAKNCIHVSTYDSSTFGDKNLASKAMTKFHHLFLFPKPKISSIFVSLSCDGYVLDLTPMIVGLI